MLIAGKIQKKKRYNLITIVSQASQYVKDFNYQGKPIILKLIEENMTPKHFDTNYNRLQTYTLFINENPVVSIWVIDALSKKREMIFNQNYNTNDLFKILKLYKKEYNKAWHEHYKTTYVTNKKAMY